MNKEINKWVERLGCEMVDTSKYFDIESLPKTNTTIGVIYMGLTSYPDKRDNTARFLEKCKEMVESDHFEAVLAPVMKMGLMSVDRSGRMRNKDGSYYFPNTDIKDVDPSELIKRCMFLFYFKSKLTMNEAIDRYGNIFCNEGALPSEWDFEIDGINTTPYGVLRNAPTTE